ncbi:MAG: hypothetical protein NTW96_25740 [Planctomycetia bacterium]|nr:hypothetical protein [Planctomycetia bacterium]
MTDLEKAKCEIERDIHKQAYDDTRTLLAMTAYNEAHPDVALDVSHVEAKREAAKRLLVAVFSGVELDQTYTKDLRLVLVKPPAALIHTIVVVNP